MPEQTFAPCDASPIDDTSGGRSVVRCDFKRSGKFSETQLRILNTLHESVAREVALALGGYLRISVECRLASVAQVAYREVITRIAPQTYVATVAATRKGEHDRGVLQLDLAVAFPTIDLLLGGVGKPESNIRELTEVEEHVLESAIRLICRELRTGWQPLGTDFEFEGQQSVAKLSKIMSSDERMLVTSFDFALPEEVKGRMTISYPAGLTNALLRVLERDAEYERPRVETGRERVRQVLMDSSFGFELSFPDLLVPATRLAGLSVGQVLPLGCGMQESATALVEGIPVFAARAARSGSCRAAQIIQVQTPDKQRRGQNGR